VVEPGQVLVAFCKKVAKNVIHWVGP
jgi:hypothetical protein